MFEFEHKIIGIIFASKMEVFMNANPDHTISFNPCQMDSDCIDLFLFSTNQIYNNIHGSGNFS